MANIEFTDEVFSEEEVNSMMGSQPSSGGVEFTDEIIVPDTDNELPSYANGLAPEAAINQSPVSFEDRAKLSVGNQKGKMEFLNKYYGETKLTKEGDFVVKDKADGFWKRVDPDGLGDGDPWSMTREIQELASDVIDVVPMAANIAAQIGIGAATAPLIPLTGGASVAATAGIAGAAGVGLNALETSLGRLVGTYSGDITEQAKDASIEGLMSLGGTAVAAGVKPTVKYIAKGLAYTGKQLAALNPVSRDIAVDVMGLGVKGGGKSVERLLEAGDEVASIMTKASAGGKSADDAINLIKFEAIDSLKKASKAARPALSALYDRGKAEIVSTVDDSFAVNFKQDLAPLVELFRSKGMLMEAGEKAPVDVFKLLSTGAGSADDVAKTLAEPAAKGLRLKPFERYVADGYKSGVVSELVNDKKSYEMMGEMLEEVRRYEGFGAQKGKLAAENLMQLRGNLLDKSFELAAIADANGLAPAQRFLANLKEVSDSAVYNKFQLAKPIESALFGQTDNLFSALNKKYHETMGQALPFLRANKSAANMGDQAYETLYNRVVSSSGRNVRNKTQFDATLDLLKQFSPEGKVLGNTAELIKSSEAAMAFMPNLTSGFASKAAGMGAVGAIAAGNPAVATGMAATALASSPKLMFKTVRGMTKASAFVKSLKPADRMKLLSDSKALSALYQTTLGQPAFEKQVTSKLLQEAYKGIARPEGQ